MIREIAQPLGRADTDFCIIDQILAVVSAAAVNFLICVVVAVALISSSVLLRFRPD